MKKFFILTTQRSGSTFFRMWLNNHPDIRCHGEVFLHKYRAPDGFRHFYISNGGKLPFLLFVNRIATRLATNTIFRPWIKPFLCSLFTNPHHSAPFMDFNDVDNYIKNTRFGEEGAVGFKLMYDQLCDNTELHKWMRSDKVSIIHLIRENPIDIYLSVLARKKRKIAHSSEKTRQISLKVDKRRMLRSIKQLLAEREANAKLIKPFPHIEVSYDRFFSQSGNEKIFAFLGVSLQNDIPSPRLKKLNRKTREELISNYDEIEAFLSGSKLITYLKN